MGKQHPFADRWNHNSWRYPLVGDLVESHEVVLDVGCGDGTLARYLADRGHQVIGVDADPTVLPADSQGTHFILGDVTNLPFENDSFDAVVAVMVLHQTRLDLALTEMRRVLKPGGLLVDVGYARDQTISERLGSAGDVVGAWWARRGTTAWEPETRKAEASRGWAETAAAIREILPDAEWRRIGGWRYLATWRRPA